MNRKEIEAALDAHEVWAAMRGGKYWIARRNGATHLWKTRPNDFRIPIKCGLKSFGEITQSSTVERMDDDEFNWRNAYFVISVTKPVL